MTSGHNLHAWFRRKTINEYHVNVSLIFAFPKIFKYFMVSLISFIPTESVQWALMSQFANKWNKHVSTLVLSIWQVMRNTLYYWSQQLSDNWIQRHPQSQHSTWSAEPPPLKSSPGWEESSDHLAQPAVKSENHQAYTLQAADPIQCWTVSAKWSKPIQILQKSGNQPPAITNLKCCFTTHFHLQFSLLKKYVCQQ